MPLVILLSAATGAVLGISMIVLRGRDRAAPMPFGPYLAAAGWLAMLYGNELVNGYLRVSGLRTEQSAMAPRLRIGLTGGIASGKSTVARRFTELGVPVIDADESSRFVVAPGQPGLAQVVQRFGTEVLGAEGELDRRALRDLIFADPASAATWKPSCIRSSAPTWSGARPRPPEVLSGDGDSAARGKRGPRPRGPDSGRRCGRGGAA